MEVKRDDYLKRLIDKQDNGMIKVITGLRRSGKSYLLYNLFRRYLLENITDEKHIIYLALDTEENKKFLDSSKLNEYLLSKIENENEKYYILLDEIQKVNDFVPVLNGFLYKKNVDVYVTGSNSKMLSSDISTEFRGRGDVIHLYPLTFKEYLEAYDGDKDDAWNDYVLYGGLPYTLLCKSEEDKSDYLKSLYKETYFEDIKERRSIKNEQLFNDILDVLSSQIGSLTNPTRLANIINDRYQNKSNDKSEDVVNKNTVDTYISYIEDAFLINKAQRYDIKGNHYINSPYKYYYEDIGLRNARLNFRQIDDGHIMENIIYNELISRRYNVDIGIVEVYNKNDNGNTTRKNYEVDFIVNKGAKKYYIQSAYQLTNDIKLKQEKQSLSHINDSFKKIIIVKDNIKTRIDNDGIITMGIYHFLLNKDSLDN